MNKQKDFNLGKETVNQASHEEICINALKYYEHRYAVLASWGKTIPRMIEFYKKYGEALQSAEITLPELKKAGYKCTNCDNWESKEREVICCKCSMGDMVYQSENKSFNQALDLCKPILAKWIACKKRYQDSLGERTGELITLQNDLAKKELRIGELEGDIVDGGMKYDDEVIKVAKLQKELATLKAELEDLKKEYKSLLEAYNKTPLSAIPKLQQENAKLKEEVETVRLESYGEALKNKMLRELLNEKETTCEHDWQAEWVKPYMTSSAGQKMRCTKCLIVTWIYD